MKQQEIFQRFLDNLTPHSKDKYYHINKAQFIDLMPIDIGYGRTYEWNIVETYPYYSFHYLVEGEAVLQIGEERYPIKKNQLFLVPPNTPVNYYNKNENNLVAYLWLNFNGLKSDDIINLTAFSKGPVITTRNKKQIYALLMQALIDCTYPILQKISPLQALYSILKILILEYDDYKIEHEEKPLTDFQSILSFINLNLYSPEFNARYVCKQYFISPEHLSRLFVKNMNMHLTSYVNIERIKLASNLLTETDLPIKQIALRAGYRDVFYFCKIFKKYRCYTPSEYRIRNKKP